jgi:ParB family transcriptional regulator, chromosome partitioning protein
VAEGGSKRGLGRGLDALLGGATATAVAAAAEGGELRRLPLDLIEPGRLQPREAFEPEALEDLARSIRARGVVQPVVVRPLAAGRYELIAGERRWRAAQLAGLGELPALVREVGDEAALAIALIENIQREDLNPLEEASALRRLAEEFDLTHQEVADAVGRSRVGVTNLMRLLELPADVQEWVRRGSLEMGHARALLGLDPSARREAATTVVERDLTVRQTEALVRRLKGGGPTPGKSSRREDPDVRRLEGELGERIGAAVSIRHGRRGRGTLTIRYGSLEELDGILSRIR